VLHFLIELKQPIKKSNFKTPVQLFFDNFENLALTGIYWLNARIFAFSGKFCL